jgi:hypothetical protein
MGERQPIRSSGQRCSRISFAAKLIFPSTARITSASGLRPLKTLGHERVWVPAFRANVTRTKGCGMKKLPRLTNRRGLEMHMDFGDSTLTTIHVLKECKLTPIAYHRAVCRKLKPAVTSLSIRSRSFGCD